MRALFACLALSLALPFTAGASGDEDVLVEISDSDDIVRLPGQTPGQADKLPVRGKKAERLVPGGVLLVSFDEDGDGMISGEELSRGITAAFAQADANGDGELTALEQQAWAASLPARDDTLSNPVRFDPNLDRIVTFSEFSGVVLQLAATYQDASGNIALASLVAPDRPEREDRRFADGDIPRGELPPGGPQR